MAASTCGAYVKSGSTKICNEVDWLELRNLLFSLDEIGYINILILEGVRYGMVYNPLAGYTWVCPVASTASTVIQPAGPHRLGIFFFFFFSFFMQTNL